MPGDNTAALGPVSGAGVAPSRAGPDTLANTLEAGFPLSGDLQVSPEPDLSDLCFADPASAPAMLDQSDLSPAPASVSDDALPGEGLPRGRRILIVDDNVDSADSLAMLLQLSGHEAHTAYDGLQALETAQRLQPDVMLLDLGLPGLDGCEVCRRVRQQPWARRTLLVAVTGWGQAADRQRSQDAGFDVHLVKPVDVPALEQIIAGVGRRG
jgi:CheY-like chemotaxis protein